MFKATLQDAFAKAHVMTIDDVEVTYAEASQDHCLLQMASDTYCYSEKHYGHEYTFTDGKATFTDSDEVVRKVEVFRIVPMTSLEDV